MSVPACLLEPDGLGARVLGEHGDVSWRAEGTAGDAPADSMELRRAIAQGAEWLAERAAPAKRIDLVCVGVSGAMCRFISAPSADLHVVAAAARGASDEWDESLSIGAVEPLAPPDRKRSGLMHRAGAGESGARHFPVLAMRDAPVRLWLDELDRRGVRWGAVTTLWHAMCRAWDATPPTERALEDIHGPATVNGHATNGHSPVTAILLAPAEGGVIWAWSSGRRLVTAGVVGAPTGGAVIAAGAPEGEEPEGLAAGEPVAAARDGASAAVRDAGGRIALDWLAWSSQIAREVARIVVVGPNADAMGAEMARVWPSAPVTTEWAGDPVGETLRRVAPPEGVTLRPEPDPRTCVVGLTNRPGRAHRRLMRWSAVVVLALAVGVAAIGWQVRRSAAEVRGQSERFRQQAQAALTALAQRSELPANLRVNANDPDPVRALTGVRVQLQQSGARFDDPPNPLPMLAEVVRIAQVLDTVESAKIDRIELSDARSTLVVDVPDIVAGERLIEGFRRSSGRLRWVESAGALRSGKLTLNGVWQAEGAP